MRVPLHESSIIDLYYLCTSIAAVLKQNTASILKGSEVAQPAHMCMRRNAPYIVSDPMVAEGVITCVENMLPTVTALCVIQPNLL